MLLGSWVGLGAAINSLTSMMEARRRRKMRGEEGEDGMVARLL